MPFEFPEVPEGVAKLSSEGLSTIENQKDEELLQNLPVETCNQLNSNYNEVYLVHFEGDGDAISKPQKGEAYLSRMYIERGTYYLRERASYLVSEALGFGIVPPTVIREIDGKVSSVQRFIPESNTYYETWSKKPIEFLNDNYLSQMQKLMVLDYLTFIGDRHNSNLLISSSGIHAIDNGLTFSNETIYYFKYPQGTPSSVTDPLENIPSPEIFPFVDNLVSDSEKLSKLEEKLGQLLKKEELDAFHNRLVHLHHLLSNTPSINMYLITEYNPKQTSNVQN